MLASYLIRSSAHGHSLEEIAAERTGRTPRSAKEAGFDNLKGHKSVGGMRASLYNAMPIAGVQALVDYLQDFERLHA